jgi:hypothetical protein
MLCSSRFRFHLLPSTPLSVGDVSLPPFNSCRHSSPQ